MDIQKTEGIFDALGGVKLFQRRWMQPEGTKPKFTVLGIHGLGEHSGRYDHVGEYAVSRGGELFMFDLQGHGKSSGKWGHFDRFVEILGDTALFHQTIYEEEGKTVVFVLGHSLGGLIAARYAQENPEHIKGLILSGAALEIAQPIPGWQKSLGNFFSKYLPKFTMSNNIDPKLLSTDSSVGEKYKADPLVHRKVSARLYTELVSAMDEANSKASGMELPVLVMHGTEDALTAVHGSENFHANCGSSDKILKLYEGCYHEIFNEKTKEQVLKDTFDWIDAHL